MDWLWLAISTVITVITPFAVAYLMGIDRRITARMQNRVGPPLLQPIYDLLKLLSKTKMVVNRGQLILATMYVTMSILAFWLFIAGADLLIIFFVLSAAAAFYTLAAYAVLSPYSQLGATRELIQLIAYEPVLLLAFFCIWLVNGDFTSVATDKALVLWLPLTFAALIIVLLVKLQKSPYDVAEAHTEIVSGPEVEYSGKFLGLVKFGRWYEIALMFAIISLFFGHSNIYVAFVGKVLIVFLAYFIVILVDNSTARLRFGQMARGVLPYGLALTVINALIVWAIQQEVIPWP